MKGGYKLIDFKNVNIPKTGKVIINGIYESIENSYRKPLIFTGLVIDNIEKNDMFISLLSHVEDGYLTNFVYLDTEDANYRIYIHNNDEVEIIAE